MENCICGSGNTGYQKCDEALKHITGLILVHRRGSSGELNKIDFELTPEKIKEKLQAPNKLDRWYPVANGDINKDIEINPLDANTQSFTDGSTAKTTKPKLVLENMFIQSATPAYMGKLDSFCGDMCAYVIDSEGTLVGQILQSDKESLYPKVISTPSYSVSWQAPTADRLSGILMNFEFSAVDRTEDIRWIDYKSIGSNLNEAQGLYDVNLVATATSDLVTTLVATDCFGFPAGPVTGITDLTDYVFIDKDGLSFPISSIADVGNVGIYTVGHASATGLYPLTIKSGTTVYAKNYELIETTVTE